MITRILLRIAILLITFCILTIPVKRADSYAEGKMVIEDKPPEPIQGGEWSDDFLNWQIQESTNVDVQYSHLYLKFIEQLQWQQTWTAHFADGDFFQTEAISDSVRLAWNDQQHNFFMTGIYTSTVFSAGRAVDWAFSHWRYSGNPEGLLIEMRTGTTPIPDQTWSTWKSPKVVIMEYSCLYMIDNEAECFTNMNGIDSSPYIQYRATFDSDDPAITIALNEINILYGIHCSTGSALSIPIPPIDLLAWDKAIITSTAPLGTLLKIDIVAPDGTVIQHDVDSGDSLAAIDPHEYPAIQLRASLSTTSIAITPDIDLWGLQWSVLKRLYLPTIQR